MARAKSKAREVVTALVTGPSQGSNAGAGYITDLMGADRLAYDIARVMGRAGATVSAVPPPEIPMLPSVRALRDAYIAEAAGLQHRIDGLQAELDEALQEAEAINAAHQVRTAKVEGIARLTYTAPGISRKLDPVKLLQAGVSAEVIIGATGEKPRPGYWTFTVEGRQKKGPGQGDPE